MPSLPRDAMDLLSPGQSLAGLRGKSRVAILDHRPPLVSPITLLVMVLRSAGFAWYGGTRTLPDGSSATTCYLDTIAKLADGTERRKVVWTFVGDDLVDVGGDPVSLQVLSAALGYAPPCSRGREISPPRRGALAVLAELRRVLPLTGEMPFNERGRRLLASAHETSNPEVRRWIGDIIELYRGYVWKLSTPIDHPPHPEYGYPLDRHLRYVHGKRKGDVRVSQPYDARMEELRQLGLR